MWFIQKDDGEWYPVGNEITQHIDKLLELLTYGGCPYEWINDQKTYTSFVYKSSVTGENVRAVTNDGFIYDEFDLKTHEMRHLWKR